MHNYVHLIHTPKCEVCVCVCVCWIWSIFNAPDASGTDCTPELFLFRRAWPCHRSREMSDGRQRSAKRVWPSLPSVPFPPKTNRVEGRAREMQQMPTSTSCAPERKWINKQTQRRGCTSGQREISAWRHSTDPTAGTDTLHNPGKHRPLLKRPRPKDRDRK